jgi:CHAT domain-containing protein
LVEDYTISYTPSATVLKRLGRDPSAPDRRHDLAAFADPSVDPTLVAANAPSKDPAGVTRTLYDEDGFSFSPLMFARQEAEDIATYARRGRALFVGEKATEEQTKRLSLDQYKVIHFATHSFVVEQSPARSAIVLRLDRDPVEDGFLQAWEIYEVKLNADLVVLSACQTGRSPFIAGEGVQGLPHAFFAAGARAVLISLWDVNDRWTAQLMQSFYRRLGEGMGKAEALRQAKLSLLESAEGRDPRLWAAFIVTGEADQAVGISGPSFVHRHSRSLLMLGAAVLMVLVGAYFLRRK